MLLSFAQFEREVTAERIRDKIAASKAKGLWMGGTVPLGYAPNPDKTIRGLVIREDEAATVKAIFETYTASGCLSRSERSLASQGCTGRLRANGLVAPLSRGAIHKILTNPIYIGKIRHKDKVYQGQHAPIISECTWDQVQTRLQSNSKKRRGHQLPAASDAWLKGKLYDPTGDQLTPTHTRKNGRKIRYYISNRLLNGKDPTGYRLPALVLEQRVCELIAAHLKANAGSGRLLNEPSIEQVASTQLAVSKEFTPSSNMAPEILANFADIIARGDLRDDSIVLVLCRSLLGEKLGLEPKIIVEDACVVTAPFALRKRGVEQKVVLGSLYSEPDRVLQNALAAAHLWLDQVKSGTTIAQISKANATSESLIRTRIRLAFLSPTIQADIMGGTQPADLTLAKLLRNKVDPSWQKQEQQLLQ